MSGIEELLADNGIGTEDDVVETPTEEAAPQTDVKAEEGVSESAETPPVEIPAEEAAPPVEDPREREVRELRQMLRDNKKEMMAMKAAISRAGQKPKLDEDGEEIPPEPSRIEVLQNSIVEIGQAKSAILDVLVETMEMSPKYEDVRQVCTKSNFDDIFETAALKISRDSGKPFEEALLEVELSVWKMSNPYKYMYGVIKAHHPRYTAKTQTAAPTKPTQKPAPAAPSSVSGMGGGDVDLKSGWTASRIDAMDVEDLDKVPRDIYEKYLMGTLK